MNRTFISRLALVALLPVAGGMFMACSSDDDDTNNQADGGASSSSSSGSTSSSSGSTSSSSGGTFTVPTTCDTAHGGAGCCSADGATSYYFDGTEVASTPCTDGTVCGWDADNGYYDCVATAAADPSGDYPMVCSGPIDASLTGCPVACTSTADCSGDTPACDTTSNVCVACLANSDCSGDTAVCDTSTNSCVGCLAATDCSGATPFCYVDATTCVSCLADADCAATAATPFCSDSTKSCVSCKTSFDCKTTAAPFCDSDGACAVGPSTCTGDDTFEDGDDGPSGATDITPTSGDTNTVTNHSICGMDGEVDSFKFAALDGDSVTLSLSWTDTTKDLDIVVLTATGETLGLDYWLNPAAIKLDYLAAGTYQVIVSRYDGQTPSAAVTPYSLAFTRTRGNKCASATDCAKDNSNSLYRGSCLGTGACVSLAGAGAVATGGACDSADDCVSKLCAATPFNSNATKFGICAAACTDDAGCTGGQVCTTVYTDNFCTPKCAADSECPVDLNTEPASGPWSYLTCTVATGKCDQAANP